MRTTVGKLILMALLPFLIYGCQQKGGAEKAGERVDEIVDNVKKGESPLHKKGPVEKLGEDIDKTIDKDKR